MCSQRQGFQAGNVNNCTFSYYYQILEDEKICNEKILFVSSREIHRLPYLLENVEGLDGWSTQSFDSEELSINLTKLSRTKC